MGRPKKTEVDSKIENQETKKPKKTSTKSKEVIDASGFRTTIPPGDAYKLKMTTSEGEKIVISENLSQIVDAIKKSKQDSKKVKIDSSKVIKTQPRMINENLGKSILHKLKDATLNFFRGFKK